MKPDEQRMRDVLVDTIRLLCRTGVEYSRRLRVQGLLGITVDDERVFLIHVDDCIAGNCTDVDDSLGGSAYECNAVGRDRVGSDVVAAHVNSGDCSDFQDVHENCTKQYQLGSVVQHPKHWSQSRPTHDDILTSVAVSEISSVVAASTVAQDMTSPQLSFQNTQHVPLHGNSSTPVIAETVRESEQFASNGNVAEPCAVQPDALMNLPPQSSESNEIAADDKNEPPVLIKMEVDAGEGDRRNNSVVAPFTETNSSLVPCMTAAVDQNQRRPLNLDDVDSSSADTNEDVDSEHTSESEEIADHLTVPRLDLVSSLHYNPRALVQDMSGWQVGSMQRCGSDGGTDAVPIQPAVLTGSQASTYYQQQVALIAFRLCMLVAHIFNLNVYSFSYLSFGRLNDNYAIIKWSAC